MVSAPRRSSSPVSPAPAQGRRPTERRSTARGQQRSKKPQPEHLPQPTGSLGSCSESRTRRMRSSVSSAPSPPSYGTSTITQAPMLRASFETRIASRRGRGGERSGTPTTSTSVPARWPRLAGHPGR
jgi:hypothetical protein